MRIRKGQIKLSPFPGDMTKYIENPKKSTKLKTETKFPATEFKKVVKDEKIIQKLVIFLYTSNKNVETQIGIQLKCLYDISQTQARLFRKFYGNTKEVEEKMIVKKRRKWEKTLYLILRLVFQLQYNEDCVIFGEGQACRLMKQNRDPRNSPTQVQPNDFGQICKSNSTEQTGWNICIFVGKLMNLT